MNTVILCSRSEIKFNAVKNVFPYHKIITIESQSGIPEQPYGIDEILKGVNNRYSCSKDKGKDKKDQLVISIENGIIRDNESLYDIGIVKIWYKDVEHISYTKMVPIPNYYDFNPNITWGKKCSVYDYNIKHDNPHKIYNLDRIELLKDAIVICNNSICEKYKYKCLYDLSYYPFKGISKFYDITDILYDPDLLTFVIDKLVELIDSDTDYIAGIEARGFIFGPLVAQKLKKPFIMIRKAGKYPNSITSEEYETEYSKDSICISSSLEYKNKKIVLVDDIVATGGTFRQSKRLLESQGAIVANCVAIIDLKSVPTKQDVKYSVVIALD